MSARRCLIATSMTKACHSSCSQIHAACQNAGELEWASASAVEARIELDLRIGASFTRLQSLRLQGNFAELDNQVVSYGPCQFPTLGFVVDRYEKVKSFIPEQFWYIHLEHKVDLPNQSGRGARAKTTVTFLWDRQRLFNKQMAMLLFEHCRDAKTAEVTRITRKPTRKFKPYPLTTVELQKAGSRLLKLAPKRVLDIAESLYQKGFLSYPRTETDQYDKEFDFHPLIEKQHRDGSWGTFAQSLTGRNFERPRLGRKNDQAHPPIHPTSYATGLTGDDKRVYEFVTRRFLASCSKDATGQQTTVVAQMGEEAFHMTGIVVQERNYLDVYPYDKWETNVLPEYNEGDIFTPSSCTLKEGETSPPKLLTEADLVSLMDKNGIGTDATIAEHIAKVIERMYVMKIKQGDTDYLVPSTLGIGLVEGYNRVDLDKSLSKPFLRREVSRILSF